MAFQRTLPHVDPAAPQGPLHRALMHLASTKFAAAAESAPPARLTVWRLAPLLMRLTGGRFASLIPVPIGVVETLNPKNNQPHRRVVIYFHDGDDVIVIPSKSGLPDDPHWYRNALAEPDVRFESLPFRAEPVEDEASKSRLWLLALRFYPPSETYRKRAAKKGRTIPILRLVPRP